MARTSTPTPPNTDVPTPDPVDDLPGVIISGVLPAHVSEAVESHRWANRLSRGDIVRQAVTEWAEKHDLLDAAREKLTAQLAADAEKDAPTE